MSAQGTGSLAPEPQNALHKCGAPSTSCNELNSSSWMEHPTCGWKTRQHCKGYLRLEGNTQPRNLHFWSCHSGTAEHVYYDCRSEAQKCGVQEIEFSPRAGRRIILKRIFLFSLLCFFFFFPLYITNSNSFIPHPPSRIVRSQTVQECCSSKALCCCRKCYLQTYNWWEYGASLNKQSRLERVYLEVVIGRVAPSILFFEIRNIYLSSIRTGTAFC